MLQSKRLVRNLALIKIMPLSQIVNFSETTSRSFNVNEVNKMKVWAIVKKPSDDELLNNHHNPLFCAIYKIAYTKRLAAEIQLDKMRRSGIKGYQICQLDVNGEQDFINKKNKIAYYAYLYHIDEHSGKRSLLRSSDTLFTNKYHLRRLCRTANYGGDRKYMVKWNTDLSNYTYRIEYLDGLFHFRIRHINII